MYWVHESIHWWVQNVSVLTLEQYICVSLVIDLGQWHHKCEGRGCVSEEQGHTMAETKLSTTFDWNSIHVCTCLKLEQKHELNNASTPCNGQGNAQYISVLFTGFPTVRSGTLLSEQQLQKARYPHPHQHGIPNYVHKCMFKYFYISDIANKTVFRIVWKTCGAIDAKRSDENQWTAPAHP